MKPIKIIVAMDEDHGIGKEGTLAWHIPSDLKRFKEITTSVSYPSKKNAVIMGRRTWDSLPENRRPLPWRVNVVLSKQPQKHSFPVGVLVHTDLWDAYEKLDKDPNIENIFVIGGSSVFESVLKDAKKRYTAIYVTKVEGKFGCDVFFPPIPSAKKEPVLSDYISENGISFQYIDYSY